MYFKCHFKTDDVKQNIYVSVPLSETCY